MQWLDYPTSAWFCALLVAFLIMQTRLIDAINKYLGHSGSTDAPGVAEIRQLVTLQVVACALRAFETSMQGFQKAFGWEVVAKDTSYWPTVMALQCSSQLFATWVLFYSIALLKTAEDSITADPRATVEKREKKPVADDDIALILLD